MTTRIRILATGGTIAGRSGPAGAYRAGEIGIDQLLGDTGAPGITTGIEAREVARVGSQDIGWPEWQALHRECSDALADPSVAGVVITHGTDTAEETALLLDLTLPAEKPVVLVGAMRPADAPGSDGQRNLANALRVVEDEGAAGRGVLLVMGDAVFAARDARKTLTQGVDAFHGFPRGPLAAVTPTSLTWFGPSGLAAPTARFALPDAVPRVEIIHAYAGMDARTAEALLATGAKGLVLAGMGQGNASAPVIEALAAAVRSGVAVVRSTRVCTGLVDRNVEVDDDRHGFVAARGFNPAKSRILLQLLIAAGETDPARMQAAFDAAS